jgi:tRNA(Ile)-lysidine synthase
MSLITSLQACIEAYSMLLPHAKVLVAVSGGPDSMALLVGLWQLQAHYNCTLLVAHINHQLRGEEAGRDAKFVRQQAERLELPYYQTQVDVKTYQRTSRLSPQHAARQLRYASLRALQESLGATRIALGHTADDQAETLLLRLLRGTGPAGLAGIPAVRLPFIRPLITTYRTAILSYLQTEGVLWVEDSSNTHRTYLRNRIRLDLLPVLQQYNPQVRQRLITLAEMLQADHALLEQQTMELLPHIVSWRSDRSVMIRCELYTTISLALQRRLLRYLFDRLLVPPTQVHFQHIDALRQFIGAVTPRKRLGLPGGFIAEHQRDTVVLWHVSQISVRTQTFILPVPGIVEIPDLNLRLIAELVHIDAVSIETNPNRGFLALEALHLPLQVRFLQPGDRFHPLGSRGRKKLSDFFIDSKIPRAERTSIVLVLSGTEIVWVVGHRIAEPVKVRPETQQIVQLRSEKIEGH